MIRVNRLQKAVAVMCAIVLTLSAIGINLFTLADDTTPYKHILSQSDISTEGDNLLENNLECKRRFMSYNSTTGKMENIWETKEESNIRDFLSAWHEKREDCKTADLPNDTTQKENCWQIHIKLNQTVNNPKTFLFWAHESEKDKVSQHYAVFMAGSEEELFNEENKVIEITDTAERLGDQIDLTKTGKTLTGITYVGVRFYQRGFLYNGFCSTQCVKLLGLYGSTESTPYKHILSQSDISTEGDNLLENNLECKRRFMSYNSTAGKLENVWETKEDSNIQDNLSAWHEKREDCKTAGLPNDITQKENCWQIHIKLDKKVSNPKTFLFWAHESEKDKVSQHYAVFMAGNEEELFNEENKVIEITDTAERLGDQIDLTKTGKTLTGITYVGVRFYHRGFLNNGFCSTQCVKLLGLYGGTVAAEDEVKTVHDASQVDTSGTNYLLNGSYDGGFYSNGQKTSESSTYGPDSDGNWIALGNWHYEYGCNINTLPNDTVQKNNYWQIEINMQGKLSNPERIVFLAHKNEDNLMSGHYAIFASSSKTKLFDEENKIIEVTDSTNRLGDEINLKKLGKKLENISYVGIRFYHRGYTTPIGCTIQHMYLLGMYGGTFKEDSVEIRTYNGKWEYGKTQLTDDIKFYGSDLIAGKLPYSMKVNGATPSKWVSMAMATDFDFDSHVNYDPYSGQADGTCDFIYKLDDDPDVIKKIKKFVFRGHCEDKDWADQYITGKYEVYAAVNYTELFNSENLIYSYDYEKDGISRTQTATFKSDTVYARYVAVRIIKPVTTCTDVSYFYPRISEIAFLGSEVNITPEEKQINSNMPLSVFVSNGNGNKNDITSEISLEEYDALTDNDNNTSVEFKTAGKQLDFVVNLLKDYKITKAIAENASKMGYTVYAAKKFSDVWSESSKLSSGAFTDSSAGVTARYVRFSFDMSKAKALKLNELLINGLTNPLIKPYEHLGLSVDNTTVSSFEKPIGSTDIADINQLSNTFAYSFDGDTSKEDSTLVTGGEVGKSTLNILVKLSGLQNINEISMSFTPHLVRYQPTKVNVYIGETYEEAMDLTKSPSETFNGLPEAGTYYCRIKPTLARYIRFEIVENNYNKGTKNIYGDTDEDIYNKTKMAVALSEIDIVGTSVSGMADENGVLLSFEQSGIKWNLKSLDDNDVPSDVYSSKLVPVNITFAQKKSLYKSPYYKIINDKAYKIEFYDIFGNQISNLGGREIEVSFPVDAEGQYIIGNTSDDSTVKFYDVSADGSFVTVTDKYTKDMQLAVLTLTDSDDSYWNGITVDENTNNSDSANNTAGKTNNSYLNKPTNGKADADTETAENNKERETRTVVLGTETKHSVSYPGIPTYLIVLLCIEGVLFLAAIAVIIFFAFRGKRKEALLISKK